MPTHEEEPAWPSDDSDAATAETGGDGPVAEDEAAADAGAVDAVPDDAVSEADDEPAADGAGADDAVAGGENLAGDGAVTEAAGEDEAAADGTRADEAPADGEKAGDGGATAQLPVGSRPRVSLSDQQTLWVERPSFKERKPSAEAEQASREEQPSRQESDQERTALMPAIQPQENDQERTALMPAVQQQPSPQESDQERTAFMPVVRVQPPRQVPREQVTAPQQLQPPQRSGPPTQRPIPQAGLVHAQPIRIEPSGEMRPAESVQPSEATPPPPEPPRKRKRRGLLIGAVALVLVIAVGVALAIPDVSNRLGLPWAPNFPKADTPEPAAVTLALQPPSTSAPTPSSSGVSSALAGPAGNSALGTLAGIVIDPATGATLWNHNSEQLLTPASATKLLTTSAALLKLDHGLQIPTKVVQGTSPDTAIIVAGGDPTLSSLPDGKESVYPGAAHLDDLVSQVKKASGGTIKKVQIDLSIYSGQPTASGWAPEDAPSTYAAPVVPAMLDGGRPDPTADEVLRSGNPAGVLLQSFAQKLGATAAGGATAAQGAKVLGEVRSAPLTELVDNLLQISDNNLAEAIGRQTAIASGAPATFGGVAQATLNTLAQNGFDVSGVVLNDGSGLSTMNKVSPRLLAQLLTVAAASDNTDPRTAKLRPLLEGLPVAGGSGTLADRYGDATSSAGKGWVRAKTGTLSGVNTLAGVVLDKDGRVLVFAMMSNGSNVLEARPALDALAATLRGCGCR